MDRRKDFRQGAKDQSKLSPFANAVNEIDNATQINDDGNDDNVMSDQNDAVALAIKNAERIVAQKQHDNDIKQKISETTQTGWFNVDMSQLGKQGLLYPNDLQLMYRAARTAEIRHWSNMDESASIIEASEHITDMISVCVKAVSKSGRNQYSYKDIYEHDKWKLLMLIHEVTFPENSELTNPIRLKITGACKHSYEMSLSSDNITFVEPDEKFDKYIDSEEGVYNVVTKTLGTVRFKPSTIGVAEVFKNYVSTLDREQILNAKITLMVCQYLAIDWRNFKSNKDVEKLCQNFNGLNAFKEMPLMLDIYNKIKILPADIIKTTCPTCGMEGTAPFRFQQGIKQIFTPVSNLDEELL